MPRTPTKTFEQDGSDHSLSHWMHICGLGSQSTSCGSMSSDSCASAGRMTHLLLPICGSNMDSPSLLNQNNAYWPIVDVIILKITDRTSHLSDIPEIPRALGLGASNCKPGPDLFFVFLIYILLLSLPHLLHRFARPVSQKKSRQQKHQAAEQVFGCWEQH